MGATSSKDNEDLTDTLIHDKQILSPSVELGFRLVDRAKFFPEKYRDVAYTDQPFKIPELDANEWQPGLLHISAPCMYACVLEKLELRKGHSFLNIGSGSGWLNTVAGFLLGANGINHGIEIHQNLIEYAEKVLTETLSAGEVAAFDFCKPFFIHGNGLAHRLPKEHVGYDRIYCGASIRDDESVHKILRLLDIGGRLVAPIRNGLFVFCRISERKYISQHVMPCQFAELVTPAPDTKIQTLIPIIRPSSLKDLCRNSIRAAVRRRVDELHPFSIRLIKSGNTAYNDCIADDCRVTVGEDWSDREDNRRVDEHARPIQLFRREDNRQNQRRRIQNHVELLRRAVPGHYIRFNDLEGDLGEEAREFVLPDESDDPGERYMPPRRVVEREESSDDDNDELIGGIFDIAVQGMRIGMHVGIARDFDSDDDAEEEIVREIDRAARRVIQQFAHREDDFRLERARQANEQQENQNGNAALEDVHNVEPQDESVNVNVAAEPEANAPPRAAEPSFHRGLHRIRRLPPQDSPTSSEEDSTDEDGNEGGDEKRKAKRQKLDDGETSRTRVYQRRPRCPSPVLDEYGKTHLSYMKSLPIPHHLTRFVCFEN